jgi:radical SAM protein with 4Fe4S-binding SPASM domain
MTYRVEGPTHLQIEPTSRCDFRCGFCVGRHMPQGDLSFDLFKSVIDQLPTLRYLHLRGEGEPLLNRDFFRMARYARTRGLTLSLITDGSLVSQQAITELLDLELTWIGISLESLDRARFRESRGGSLDRVLDNVRALVQQRDARGRSEPDVSLTVTVLTTTVHEIESIKQLSRQLGLSPPHFQALQRKPASARFYPIDLLKQVPSEEELAPVRQRMREQRQWREAHGLRNDDDELWSDWNGPGCAFVSRSLYIEHTGHVTPCCMIKDHDRPSIGNRAEQPAAEIWHARARTGINAALDHWRVPDVCRGCPVVEP